jgi:spermidine synthase
MDREARGVERVGSGRARPVRVVRASDRTRLVIRRRADVVEILSGSVVLLSSAALETELAFGRVVGDVVKTPRRVLVGGLGFGATVRGALEAVGDAGRVTVVEKVAGVVDLVRCELASLAGHVLDDPRVTVEVADVGDVIRAADGVFDAILLDVDNGPEWASFRSNARLYTPAGLAEARRALASGGALAVWSGYPSDAFLPRLRRAGFEPRRILLRERGRVRARAYVGLR